MSNHLKTFALIVMIISIVVFVINCSEKEEIIKIGMISPFSGDGAVYGEAAQTAIDLAVDEINSKGGINGKKLVVQYEDDKGTPKDAVSAFQKLASVDKVSAVIGPFYSSNVLACAPVAEKLNIVLLTGSATSDNVRNAGDFVFRTCPSNDMQAKTIADYAYKKLNLKKAFIIYRNVDYGVTLRDAFEKAFKEINGEIVGIEAVVEDATDVRAQLLKVKNTKPDLLYAAVHYPEGSRILRQAKELGISCIIIGTDGGFDPQLINIAGNAAEGSYWVTIGWGDERINPAVAAFKKSYKERYGKEPGVYSGLYYDAVNVLVKAISSTPILNGKNLQKYLVNTTFEGPTGKTEFDSYGDVNKPFSIFRIENGKFVLIP